MARRTGPWNELGSRARDADRVAQSISELHASLDAVPDAVERARSQLRPEWARAAKDTIIDAYEPLRKAIEQGKLTASTSGHSLLTLPRYNDEHVFTRARRLAEDLTDTLEYAERVRSKLSLATTGDTERIERALGQVEQVLRTVPQRTVKEEVMSRTRYEPSSDSKHFKEHLANNVILVAGEAESVNLDDEDPIFVAVVVNVTGYGPHPGAIYAHQNRYHASGDSALEGAFDLLEEWEQEHYPAENEEDEEHRTETFDGLTWKLTPQEFEEAIRGTPAVKFLELEEDDDEEEDDEYEEEDEENVLEEAPSGARPDRITVYWDETDRRNVGWGYDADYPGGRRKSGPIEGRRNCSDATLTSRARAAVGHPGTRIPVKIDRRGT